MKKQTYLHVATFIFIITFLCFTSLVAQERYTNYDYTNGLPIGTVQAMAQDSLGFIWLGGPDGLVRFNGKEFKHYIHDGQDPNSIAGNIVNEIQVSPEGIVWIVFDDNGISRFDYQTQQFTSKKYKVQDGNTFPRFSISGLAIENEESIWLACDYEGLFHFDAKNWIGENLQFDFRVKDVLPNPFNTDELFLSSLGMIRYNKKTKSIERLTEKGHKGLKIIDHTLWSHSYFCGLIQYDLQTGFSKETNNYKYDVVHGSVYHDEEFWLGTDFGILIYSPVENSWRQLVRDASENHSLLSNGIKSVFVDRDNRIWIATDEGISVRDPNIDYFESLFLDKNKRFTSIFSINESQYLALAFYQNEIHILDKAWKSVKIIPNSNDSSLYGPMELCQVGSRYFILYYEGMVEYFPEKQRIESYQKTGFEPLFDRGNLNMVKRNSSELWVAHRDEKKIIKIDVSKDSLTTYPLLAQPKGLFMQQDSVLWVYGFDYLVRMQMEPYTRQDIKLNEAPYDVLGNQIINVIVDHHDHLWIATAVNGLWRAEYKNDSFQLVKKYAFQEGIESMNPLDFVQNQDYFIVSTRAGISIYNEAEDRFVSYGLKNGLGSNGIINSLQLFNDSLFIYSEKNKFIDLNQLNSVEKSPNVIIENLFVNQEKLTKKQIENAALPYQENTIRVQYIALHLSDPKAIQYRYRLNPDQAWNFADSDSREILFTDMSPGKYTFEIAARLKGREWGVSNQIPFIINKPFWRTWWFISLIVMISLLIIYLVFRYRERQYRLIEGMKSKMLSLESESLRAQMNPHFVFNSLNSIKAFIIQNKKEEAADYLTTFSELIRSVLQNSKSQLISLHEEIKALTLYMEIENIRLNDKFDVNWDIDENIDTRHCYVSPLTLQPFVENAIWHGFIHKKSKGKLTFSIQKKNQNLFFEITDNGVGRSRSQEIEKKHPRQRSFGISITKQRLDIQHQNSDIKIIDLVDAEGNALGTCVHFSMPYITHQTK